MKNYKVSICVPIYGVESYIERCAKSLLTQTYGNIEYIFVNDCTRDNSIELLKQVIDQYPDREGTIHLITHKHNKGLAAARNTSLEYATGEFVMHIDSDDYLEADAVEKLVNFQNQTEADYITFDAIAHYPDYNHPIIHKDTVTPRELALSIVGSSNEAYIWCRFIRRSLYIDNNIKTIEGVNMGEDLQVSPILAFKAQKVAFYHQPIYHYECMNLQAYTKSYSEDKEKQNRQSQNFVYNYFIDKGIDFQCAIKESQSKRIVNSLISSVQNNNKPLFVRLRNQINKEIKVNAKHISIVRRIILYIHSFFVAKIYVSLSVWVYKKVKRIRYT